MSNRHAATCAALALVLLASPVAALAEGASVSCAVVDRADFYEPAGDAAVTLMSARKELVQISDEMKYFTKYESHGNYDQGFSYGDGYNALGYYQFDRRYSLIGFLRYCLSYDSQKYAMLAPVVERAAEVSDGSVPMYANGALTEVGALAEGAWHQAYATDPAEFSLLQDNYAYDNYYALTESYLRSRGISMEGRADCVKGLVWSMTNLFGGGGVRWFLDAADLSNDLTDREFVNRICDAVVDNIAARYPSQPQYHEGWIRRYENERADCLSMLPEDGGTGFVDVSTGDWFCDAVQWVSDKGFMTGYGDGSGKFGPYDKVSRAQMAMVLWNYADNPSTGVSGLPSDCDGTAFYAKALSWALGCGYVTGYDFGLFGPEDGLTREQAVTILWRYFGSPSASADLSAYPDSSSVSAFSRAAMQWAISKGVIKGTSEGKLAPQDTCTRAELAAILMRL
ncbi:S-layer homology domain-containing protein [Olsenella sp. An285]|uniref:S-layer homology domain-containing protein n=1 Tax=Olsenella sp. An285 TaxID=1965621 RepID=UPI0013022210|nr:S-layer homology domain-containing protein [Olsenella sp. An285]